MDNGGDGIILVPGLWKLVTGCLILASDLRFQITSLRRDSKRAWFEGG
jgi:hypothetical protein